MANRFMMLFVQSRLRPTSTATEEQYHDCYNNEFMPRALALPELFVPEIFVRLKNITAEAEWPYGLICAPGSIQMLHGPIRDAMLAAVRNIPSKALNGDMPIEHIEFNTLDYRVLHVFPGGDRPSTGFVPNLTEVPLTIICDYFDQPPSHWSKREKDETFFIKGYEVPQLFRESEYHIRSTSYKLVNGKSSKFVVIHEFECPYGELEPEVLKDEQDMCLNRQVYDMFFARGKLEHG